MGPLLPQREPHMLPYKTKPSSSLGPTKNSEMRVFGGSQNKGGSITHITSECSGEVPLCIKGLSKKRVRTLKDRK